MKVNELLSIVNTNEFPSLYDFEVKYSNLETVVSDIEIKRYRWYETSTTVYKCEDGFVGVNGVTECFSDVMDCNDCEYPCTAKEYEAVPSTVYKPKQ